MRYVSGMATTVILLATLCSACGIGESEDPAQTGVRSTSGLKEVGEVAWKVDAKAHGAPFAARRNLWVRSQKSVTPLSEKSGELGEAVDLGATATSPIVAAGSRLFFGAGRSVRVVDVSDGEQAWKSTTGATAGAEPVVTDGTVLVSAKELYAFDASTGDEIWSYSAEGDFFGPPSVVGSEVFVADTRGGVHSVDLNTGQAVWTLETGDSFQGAAVAASSEMIVIGGQSGYVWGIFAETGRERWRFSTGGVVAVGVAFDGQTAWVGTEAGEVVAINTRTGQERWRRGELAAIVTAPRLAAGRLYVGCDDGAIVALDAGSGEVDWSFELESEPIAAPLIDDGQIFVTDIKGRVYALH